MSISKDIDETIKRLNGIEQKIQAYKERQNRMALAEFLLLVLLLAALVFVILTFT